jgi:hypothetical protein
VGGEVYLAASAVKWAFQQWLIGAQGRSRRRRVRAGWASCSGSGRSRAARGCRPGGRKTSADFCKKNDDGDAESSTVEPSCLESSIRGARKTSADFCKKRRRRRCGIVNHGIVASGIVQTESSGTESSSATESGQRIVSKRLNWTMAALSARSGGGGITLRSPDEAGLKAWGIFRNRCGVKTASRPVTVALVVRRAPPPAAAHHEGSLNIGETLVALMVSRTRSIRPSNHGGGLSALAPSRLPGSSRRLFRRS